jgi:hypothetical protein
MKAMKAMVHDWSFWLYLSFLLMMLASVGLLSSQQRELMGVHHYCLRTLQTLVNRSAIADQEHRSIEREIQALERREEATRTNGESR